MRCAARLLTRVPVLLAAVLTFVVSPDAESADRVVPTDDVVTRVVVRASATSDSVERGSFRPGDSADLPGSAPNWYEVRLDNDVHGFVSKRWTRIGTPYSVQVRRGLVLYLESRGAIENRDRKRPGRRKRP